MSPLGGPAFCRRPELNSSCLVKNMQDRVLPWVFFAPDVHRIAPDPVFYRKFAFGLRRTCVGSGSDLGRIRIGSSLHLGRIWVGSVYRIWIGSGSDLYRIWVESGSDLFRIWVGSVSDVGSELHLCRICVGSGSDLDGIRFCVRSVSIWTWVGPSGIGSGLDLGRIWDGSC